MTERTEREATRLKSKLEQKKNAFRTIQTLIRSEQEKHNGIVESYKNKLQDMAHTVEVFSLPLFLSLQSYTM